MAHTILEKIGEDPNGIPNNLMPFITQVAVGKREKLDSIWKRLSYVDGTGVRDYIHVVDLAWGHIKALEKLEQNPGCVEYNLGTGKGYSVLEVIDAFKNASNREIGFQIVERRAGDIAACYANHNCKNELGWEANLELKKCAKTLGAGNHKIQMVTSKLDRENE